MYKRQQFRTEALKNRGETFTSGIAPTLSRAPDKRREVSAGFVEVRAPLVGPDNARPGIQKLELSLAGRVEDYDDIGSTSNPKIGALWVPADGLKLRANWGTSFRAPALTELAERRYISATYVSDGAGGQLVALFEGGGNLDLRPETAETLTLGFDLNPPGRPFRMSASWYDIRFDDQIGRPALDNLTQVLLDPTLAPFVHLIDRTVAADRDLVDRLINSPDYLLAGALPADAYGVVVDARWVNTASVHLQGVDALVGYDLDLAGGSLSLEASGSYMFSYDRQVTPAASAVDVVDLYGYPVDFRGAATATWRRDAFDVRLAVNHVSGYRDGLGAAIDPWTTADLTVGWRPEVGWGRGLAITASVRNLTDETPPFYDAVTGIGFDAGQADPFGRMVSLQITKRW